MHEDRGPGNEAASKPAAREVWINPVGGLGDTLMLSGVLQQVHEQLSERVFRLVRRPGYMSLLEGHPAIASVGFPPRDAEVLTTGYWDLEPLGPGSQRPMQILARAFGLRGPVEERFWVSEDSSASALLDAVPWGQPTVVIGPGSESPRKEWRHEYWEELTALLAEAGVFVVQVGDARRAYVRGAYSLLGLTRPRQLFGVLRRAQTVVTVDCFVMHAAHHVGLPAVVLWGPTSCEVYGYLEQRHLYSAKPCTNPDGCIGPGRGDTYARPCPCADHCVDRITPAEVLVELQRCLTAPAG